MAASKALFALFTLMCCEQEGAVSAAACTVVGAAALCAAPLGWVLYSPIKVGSNLERKEYQHDVSDIIWQNATSYDLSESVLR